MIKQRGVCDCILVVIYSATRWQSSLAFRRYLQSLAIHCWQSSGIISMYSVWIWEICQDFVAPGLNVSYLKRFFHGQRFLFFQVIHFFFFACTKTIYINSRLKLSFSGSQLAPFLNVQDSERLITTLVNVSEYSIS